MSRRLEKYVTTLQRKVGELGPSRARQICHVWNSVFLARNRIELPALVPNVPSDSTMQPIT